MKSSGVLNTFDSDLQYTIFAPTDNAFKRANSIQSSIKGLVAAHTTQDKILSTNFANGAKLNMMNGNVVTIDLTPGLGSGINYGIFINNYLAARIVKSDVLASNGVVHVIDALLQIPEFEFPDRAMPRTRSELFGKLSSSPLPPPPPVEYVHVPAPIIDRTYITMAEAPAPRFVVQDQHPDCYLSCTVDGDPEAHTCYQRYVWVIDNSKRTWSEAIDYVNHECQNQCRCLKPLPIESTNESPPDLSEFGPYIVAGVAMAVSIFAVVSLAVVIHRKKSVLNAKGAAVYSKTDYVLECDPSNVLDNCDSFRTLKSTDSAKTGSEYSTFDDGEGSDSNNVDV